MTETLPQWEPSSNDIFLLLTKDGKEYFYALDSALKNHGDHYYSRKEDGNITDYQEVAEKTIVGIVKTQRDIIEFQCPCLKIVGESIVPFFRDPAVKKRNVT